VAVSFTPGFQHTDWVDNQSLVQAAGEDGFNVRFHLLEADLKAISQAISAISDALDVLSAVPAAQPVKLTLVPILATIGNAPWQQDPGGVSKPVGAIAANGIMNVSFPAGTRVQSLRVIGNKVSGTLSVNLFRQALTGADGPQRITGVDAPNGSFDQTAAAPATDLAAINNDTFRYYLTAQLALAGANDTVSLFGFQFVYIRQ
jgi:hypothetical protein